MDLRVVQGHNHRPCNVIQQLRQKPDDSWATDLTLLGVLKEQAQSSSTLSPHVPSTLKTSNVTGGVKIFFPSRHQFLKPLHS